MNRQGFIYAFFVIVAGVFLALGTRCAYLQIQRHEFYTAKALGQQRAMVPLKGSRGVILDRCGRVLAASNRVRTVFADPSMVRDPKETAVQLASIIEMPAHKICGKIVDSKSSHYVRIKDDIDPNASQLARNLYGINIQYNWQRYYPAGNLMCHVIGFTDPYGKGKAGLEYSYDSLLAGITLKQEFLADSARRPIRPLASEVVNWKKLHGRGLILTLDATIQEFTRHALAEQVKKFEAESGLAIVAEAKTGAILAMVSVPDFDPADRGNATDVQLCNHAVIDQYEPGSILKPIVVALGLDAGVIRKDEIIYCEDGLFRSPPGGPRFKPVDEYNYHKYGNLTPKGILINSSNVGMAKIGLRLKAQRLYDGLRLFGFASKVGIPLPGEATGLLREVDHPVYPWGGNDITRIPAGHGLSVSALQMVRAYCILANEGRVVQPYLIEAVVDANGMPDTRRSGYRVANQLGYIIDPDIARWVVQDAMVAVVDEGSGKQAKLDRWTVFGKTGTAEIAREDGRGYTNENVASFIGGAPAEDPAIITLVSIRKPNRKIGRPTGGTVSAPVVGQIIENTLDYFVSRGWIAAPQTEE